MGRITENSAIKKQLQWRPLAEKVGRLKTTDIDWPKGLFTGAGGDPDLPFGNGENVISQYAWFDREPSKKYRTSSVAKLKPNEWKLYDMIGNVWEWVEDDWHDKYEEEKAPKDGSIWRDEPRSQFGVIRGASWYDVKQLANCTYRFMIDLNDPPSNNIGFRCVRTLD